MICNALVVRRTAIRAVVAATLLAASAGATATVATELPAPATTTTTNPYAVPAVIDVAYVNRVLAGLDAILGDVTRIVVSTRSIPPDAYDRLRALYATNDLLQLTIDSVQSDIRRGLNSYKIEPGNKTSTVQHIVSADSRCVFVKVERNYSAVSTSPNTVNPQWVGLRIKEATRDPKNYNPTPWMLVYDGFPQDRSTPTNPCTL